MMDLYYVVEKELHGIDAIEETTGEKRITGYDIDTQCMNLVEVFNINVLNGDIDIDVIQNHLDDAGDKTKYNMIQL